MQKRFIITIFSIFLLVILSLLGLQAYNKPIRYAVFAGYNENGIIKDYVITYLKGLDEVTDGIVYIADSPLNDGELNKLKDINILYTKHSRHEEYDWGSYKRGYNWLKENKYLEKADELIFANDSCYAPLTSFKPMFKTMDNKKELSFWGNTISTFSNKHIQSYFIVFRKNVINSQTFNNFINSITKQEKHIDYIYKYEISLTPILRSNSFYYSSYTPDVNLEVSNIHKQNPCIYPLTYMKKYKNQFIKRKIFTQTPSKIEDSKSELILYLKTNHPNTIKDIKSSTNISQEWQSLL